MSLDREAFSARSVILGRSGSGPPHVSVLGAKSANEVLLLGGFPAAAQQVIEHVVAQVFGVTHADLSIRSRGKAHVALARQVAMYLTHVVCRLTFTEVGQLFGRDRTTVAHACAVVEDRRDDPVFDRALDLLEWALPSLLMPERRFAEGAA